jgi:hypothetical protein
MIYAVDFQLGVIHRFDYTGAYLGTFGSQAPTYRDPIVLGHQILTIPVPGAVPALQAWPSPVSLGETTITFQLPRKGRASVDLFDAAGRLTARIVDGTWSAGTHSLAWKPREGGRNIPAGVYYLRLRTEQGESRLRLPILH